MIKHFHIFDCDGVLLDSTHRYRTRETENGLRIDLDHWIENCTPEKIWQDSVLPMAKFYMDCLAHAEHFVMIATARVCQQADFDSIAFKLGTPQNFSYRQAGDCQSGVTLKLRAIKRLLNLKQFQNLETITMYEDNKDYLNGVADVIGAKKVFIPSNQGY